MKPPRSVKIGYRTFRLQVRPASEMDEHNALGMCRKDEGEIWLHDGLDRQQGAETTLHEILHAVWYAMCLPAKTDEEKAVTALAKGLAGVFRDNAEAIKWILAGLKAK
jgi:hypothetical protein